MAKRTAIEAVDRTLQDITGINKYFGGKVVVLGGDFMQVLPVISKATVQETINASLVKSYLFPKMKQLTLSENMRARTDPVFCEFFLRIGNGTEVTDLEEITIGQHIGKQVFIPRIPLSPAENEGYPFQFRRKQFPIRLCFAMTINKAQGQTIPIVGVYLPHPVFSHGQLYVALSRGTSRETTKVLIRPDAIRDTDDTRTKNVVYREILDNSF
ncbi:uncharacterized protein [Henckelia pumila]|uniref:uncharacterized protein n=1 Tax=Henckelia pumila TaxID=405737 RepID=UPI003C6E2880